MVAFEIYFVVGLTGFVAKLDVGCDKKRGVKISLRFWPEQMGEWW